MKETEELTYAAAEMVRYMRENEKLKERISLLESLISKDIFIEDEVKDEIGLK
jgi:hypothetical protein